jgi:hypothetical protein
MENLWEFLSLLLKWFIASDSNKSNAWQKFYSSVISYNEKHYMDSAINKGSAKDQWNDLNKPKGQVE